MIAFMEAAWPWIAIALVIAIFAVREEERRQKKRGEGRPQEPDHSSDK